MYLVSLDLSRLQLRGILLMSSVVGDHFPVLLLVLLDTSGIDVRCITQIYSLQFSDIFQYQWLGLLNNLEYTTTIELHLRKKSAYCRTSEVFSMVFFFVVWSGSLLSKEREGLSAKGSRLILRSLRMIKC